MLTTESNIDFANCLDEYTDTGYATYQHDDNGNILIKNFSEPEEKFRPLTKWKIAGEDTLWKNESTQKLVLDADFFQSAEFLGLGDTEPTEPKIVLKHPESLTGHWREIIWMLTVNNIVKTNYGFGNSICLLNETETDSAYQASLLVSYTIFTNSVTIAIYDLTLMIDKESGNVNASSTYNGKYISTQFFDRYKFYPAR